MKNQGFLYYNRGCFYVNINENLKGIKRCRKKYKIR